ncbi:maleylpyruvate isomerase family mycothiol-dependent enzyme [Brachybacterium paraconglomeratum]|uniref:maleylpyruvate isomerase family mycothiol-dependent enzyme n=1 Tax=Brachybacterium paraconglomeratum TaxID=173362 RepID=UPI0031E7F8D8
MHRPNVLPLLHAERLALAEALRDVPDADWAHASLCAGWTVQDVLTHLTAAARTATIPWLLNMAATRFDTDQHNQRLLRRHQAADPAGTLGAFRTSAASSAAPFGALEGMLGEVIVHGQDIARPLCLPLVPSPEAVRVVAEFFVSKDFAVNSSTLVRGLRLEATDDDLVLGEGPVVQGTLLNLVMAMAGRVIVLDALQGEGVVVLRERLLSS